MKVIDLLNKIANGEEVPYKIKIEDENEIFYYQSDINSYKTCNNKYLMYDYLHNTYRLNNEVEIIEEDKKIEKIDFDINTNYKDIVDKINEIIDHINKENDK